MRTPPLVLASTIGALALLLSAAAGARPVVTVAAFGDGPRADKARNALVSALQKADQLDVVPWARVKAAAAKARIRPRDLDGRSGALEAAKVAGAQAVVFGTFEGDRLTVNVVSTLAAGREIWSRQVKLERGELTADLARRFAAAVAAATGAADDPEPETHPVRGPAPAPRTVPPPRSEKVIVVEEPAPREAPVLPSRRRTPEREDVEEAQVAELGPQGEEGPAREGWLGTGRILEFGVGYSTTWRSYRFCPEVSSCEQTPPAGAGPAVRYTTETPYGGLSLNLGLFPLRSRTDAWSGLGLVVEYAHSVFLRTFYREPEAEHSFGSSQQRFQAEAVFRHSFRLEPAGEGWVGLRAGWLWHGFLVDPNPKIVESRRGGASVGLDGTVPLHRWVRLEARASLVPWAGPGDEEKARYGATAPGGGWSVGGGLTSDLGHPEWDLRAALTLDYLRFGDRYTAADGLRPAFGRAVEDYLGLALGLKADL